MNTPVPPRRIIALIAAYAIALQALLSFFPAVPTAYAQTFIICSLDGDANGAVPPPGHDPVCPHGAACVMPGCTGGVPLPAQVSIPGAAFVPWTPAVFPLHAAQAAPSAGWAPQSPRAPPLA